MLSAEFLLVTFAATTTSFVNWSHYILLSNKTLTDNILNLHLYTSCVYFSKMCFPSYVNVFILLIPFLQKTVYMCV